MAKHSDSLRHVSDNPTGAGDIPVVSLAQWENVARPGGRNKHPGGAGESPVFPTGSARPGGQEGGAKSAGSVEKFARPGGPEGVR